MTEFMEKFDFTVMASEWRIVMKRTMEHSDDKLVEYFDDNGMDYCRIMAWGIVMKTAWSLFLTQFNDHSDDKSQGAL